MGTIEKLDPSKQWVARWRVPSSSDPLTKYVVAVSDEGSWACGCVGWTRHVPRRDCRHIKRVKQEQQVPIVPGTSIEQQVKQAVARMKPSSTEAPKVVLQTPTVLVIQTRREVSFEED